MRGDYPNRAVLRRYFRKRCNARAVNTIVVADQDSHDGMAVQADGQRHACVSLLMRICLYWNPTAGDETPLEAITGQIRDAGHDVTRVLGRKDDPSSATALAVDALVAAGGDGTVARAARALAGTT